MHRILAIVFTLFSCCIAAQPNEVIRLKTEQAKATGALALGEALQCRKSLSNFYVNRGFTNAWNPQSAEALLHVLKHADKEGLNPADYHYPTLVNALQKASPDAPTSGELDLLLSDAFLLYASHMLSGKVNPTTIDAQWFVVPREGNPIALLEQALATSTVQETLLEIAPKHSIYKGLKTALETYQALPQETWPPIATTPTIKPGAADARIPTVRKRLAVFGDLADSLSPTPSVYDSALVTAVQHFQQRHGLEPDGNMGPKTLEALNVTVGQRILQIKANLERWRWLAQEFGPYYIKVNITNYQLEVVRQGKVVRTHRVITGKPLRTTPVFSATMQYLVFNPTWTVPPTILKADVIPGVQKDPNYLSKKKLSILDTQGNVLDPATVDFSSSLAKTYTYRQPPGPDNALGAVKFMFPNSFSVYIHDTPSKELFNKSERALSSGCVRVEDPLSLAAYLLNDSLKWSLNSINTLIKTEKTQTITLAEKPNVHILYWTAWVDQKGEVQFRSDIYQRDPAVIRELQQAPPQKPDL